MACFNYYRSLFDDLRNAKELAQFIRENTQAPRLPDGSLPPETLKRIGQTTVGHARSVLRSYYDEHFDPLRQSMQSAPRYHCEDVLEAYVTEYGFLPAWTVDASDEEIDDYVDSLRMEIHSPYDCTGKRFTHYINWKRTPAGVAYVHESGLDL